MSVDFRDGVRADLKPDEQVYYANKSARGRYLHASPSKRWVELHGVSIPIVAIRLRERTASDPPLERGQPDYWGWLEFSRNYYTMVWTSRVLLDICFPSGAQGAEAAGRGRAVNLVAEEIDPEEVSTP